MFARAIVNRAYEFDGVLPPSAAHVLRRREHVVERGNR